MADIILRVAFPYRDERLYPSGWRSFSNEYSSITNIELEKEIIANFAIEEPCTSEIISMNDLGYAIADITCVIQLEITNEIINFNYLNDELTNEITEINYLSTEKTKEVYFINDIYASEIGTKEIVGLNSLRA